MHLPQQQRISLTLVTGLAALVAALAVAAMAATPGYTMPADAGGQAPGPAVVDDVGPPTARPRPPSRRRSPSPARPPRPTPSARRTAPRRRRRPPSRCGQPTWPENPVLDCPAPVTVSSDSDGFEFGSAAVGAAGVLTLGLLGLVAYAAVLRRRPVTARH